MATKNYIVLKEGLTLSDQKEYKLNALAAGLERCGVKNIGEINADVPGLSNLSPSDKVSRVQTIKSFISTGKWPRSIDQRQLAPLTDLVAPTALDDWLTAALAVVGTFYGCTQAIAAPQLLQSKLMVCYGISVGTVPVPVSRLMFRKNGATGNILAQFELQELEAADSATAFFSEPVIIDPQDIFAIQVRASIATGAAARINILNYLFENAGQVVA
jgi:hypothetical protein